MKLQTFALSALCAVFVGCGGSDGGKTNEEASVSIHVVGADAPAYRSTLQARIEDGNGVGPAEVTYSWTNSAGEVVGNGEELEIGSAEIGDTISVSVSFTDFEGFPESATSSPTDEVQRGEIPFEATFSGNDGKLTNELTINEVTSEETAESITGVVAVDDEPLEAFVLPIAAADSGAQYGEFSIDADGSWSYALNTPLDPDVAALATSKDELTETFTITSTDGTTADLVITITGYGGNVTNAARVRDYSSSTTGELTIALDDALGSKMLEGKLVALIQRPEGLVGTKGSDTEKAMGSYVTIWGEGTGNSAAVMDLNMGDSSASVRFQDAIAVPVISLDTWTPIEVSWYAPDDTTAPVVNLTINGQHIAEWTVDTANSPDALGGVRRIAFRLGDSTTIQNDYDDTAPTKGIGFYVDDIAVYDTADAATDGSVDPVWSQNFDGEDNGTVDFAEFAELGSDNGFEDRTVNSDVVEIPALDATSAGSAVVKVTDTSTSVAGEFRYKLSDTALIQKGTLTATLKTEGSYVASNANNNTAYITLFGNSASNSKAFIDLKIDGGDGTFRARDGQGGDDIYVDPTFTPGEWFDVAISWDATVAGTPTIDMTLNGEVVPTFTTTSSDLASLAGGFQTVRFKIGDSSRTMDGSALYVDDLVITQDGDDTPVWEDYFDNYIPDGEDSIALPAPYSTILESLVIQD